MPIRARLRIACTATCGSFAQAWTQMSPPEMAGSSVSPGKRGRSASAAGLRGGQPEPVLAGASRNSVGPKPTVRVSPAGGSPIASPVSSGGASEHAGGRADLAGVLARRSSGPRPRSSPGAVCDQLRPVLGDHVEGDEVQPVLGGRDDAGLVRAVERRPRRRPAPSCCRGLVGGAPDQGAADRGRAGDPGHAGAGEQRCARRRETVVLTASRPLLPGDDAGDLADRLGERVDRVGQALQLRLGELRCAASSRRRRGAWPAPPRRWRSASSICLTSAGSRCSSAGRSAATAACEPSRLAAKSHRSVCE